MAVLVAVLVPFIATGFTVGRSALVQEEEEGIIQVTKKTTESCRASKFDESILKDPCQLDDSVQQVPEEFSLVFPTSYGKFTAQCSRARAPVWADRVYRLCLLYTSPSPRDS